MSANGSKERQREGIAVARQKGIHLGRKKIVMDERFSTMYSAWTSGKMTATQAMKQLGLKSNTFYRRVKEYELKSAEQA